MRARATGLIAALAATAGALHAVALATHFSEWWAYGAFFAVVMCAQFAWAVWLYRNPGDPRALVYGALASLAVVGLWVMTRIAGLPIGPEAGDPEPVGGVDVMASVDELVIAALVAVIVAPESAVGRRLAWMAGPHAARLGSMLSSASLFSILVGGHH